MKKNEAFEIAKRVNELLIYRAKINDEILELTNELLDAGFIATQGSGDEIILHKLKMQTFSKPKSEISSAVGGLRVEITKISDYFRKMIAE